MSTERIRVANVGGSLFPWPRLVPALLNWLAAEIPRPTVLVAGGGRLVDQLRRKDQGNELSQVEAHWMAIKTMGRTARWLQSQLNDAEPALDVKEARTRLETESPMLLDVWGLLQADERTPAEGIRLPASWDVTSDSIAARAAIALDAAELVLFKSCLPEKCTCWSEAAECGYVDRYFPRIASAICNVRCVNLRDPDFGQWQEGNAAVAEQSR